MLARRVKTGLRTLPALAALAVAAYLAFYVYRQNGIHELHTTAERRLDMFNGALFAATDKYSYLPELIASHPIALGALLHKNDAQSIRRANAFLERVNSSAGSDIICLMDRDGLTVACSNWRQSRNLIGQSFAFRPYFQEALRKGSGSFYGMGTTSGLAGFYISHIVKDGNAVLGVAVVKTDLSNFDARWRNGKSREEIIVTDENGVVFLSSRAEWKYHPMHALTAQAAAQLKTSRQYGDAILKTPLSIRTLMDMPSGERIIGILQNANGNGAQQEVRYFLRSGALIGSGWTIHVLLPTAEIDAHAVFAAIVGAGVLAFLMLAAMYVGQIAQHMQEREKSRRELEEAHEARKQQLIELQKVSEELRITSITDPLTGVYNRRFFLEAVGKLVSGVNRHQFDLSIVTIDVDHFKRINDVYGHPAGDKALRMLSTLCKESLREADVFARFGGEEFILALPSSDGKAAWGAAERLRLKVMQQSIEVKGEPLHITISCGVSQYRPHEAGIDDTLKRADEALYVAKENGRNQVVLR